MLGLLWRWEYKHSCTAAGLDQTDKRAVRDLVASLDLSDAFAKSAAYGTGNEEGQC